MVNKKLSVKRGFVIVFNYNPTTRELFDSCSYSYAFVKEFYKTFYKREINPEKEWPRICEIYRSSYRPKLTMFDFLEEMSGVKNTLYIMDKLQMAEAFFQNLARIGVLVLWQNKVIEHYHGPIFPS